MEKIIENEHFNIHIIENKKFKNDYLEVSFINKYDREKLAIRECLLRMLFMGNKTYKTSRDISIRTEELYDCITYYDQTRVGSYIFSNIHTKYLNPSLIDEDNYLEDNIKFLFQLIFDGEFNQTNLDYVKSNMIAEVESIKEDPRSYAKLRAYEVLDKDDPSAITINGDIASIKTITLDDLEKEYKDFLNNSDVEISLVVNNLNDEVINIVDKYAKFNSNPKFNVVPFRFIKSGDNKIIEDKDFSQSEIVYIYNLEDLTERERDTVAIVFNEVLGGSALETRLNKSLREENSLCYGIYSSYSKYDNRLQIFTSVSKENIDKSCELIEQIVNSINNIDEEELEKAVSRIARELKEVSNRIDFLAGNKLSTDLGYNVSFEERIERYKSVKVDEVNKINSKLKLNTIYILKGVSD